MVFLSRLRVVPLLSVGAWALLGCADADAPLDLTVRHIPVTPADLSALPVASVSPGETLCSGTTADTLCPRLAASANWLESGTFAYWEINRPIRVVRDGIQSTFVSTDPARSYVATIGVGPGSMSGEVMVIDPIDASALQFTASGRPLRRLPLPPSSGLSFWNYSGPVAYQQTMEPAATGGTIDLVVRTAALPGDSSARERFRVNLPWLQLQEQQATVPPPLFPNVVVFGFDSVGNAIWSGGARFVVRQTTPAGSTRWSLDGDFTGPTVDSIDMAWKIDRIRQPTLAEAVPEWQIEAMRSISHRTTHPAISALHVAPDGQTLIAGADLPQQAAVPYYRLSADGALLDRFDLPHGQQVVLFGGDSILVFQRDSDPARSGTLAWARLGR